MSSKVFNKALGSLSVKDRAIVEQTDHGKTSAEMLMVARSLVEPTHNEKAYQSTRDGTPIPDQADISKMFHAASSVVGDARNILKSSPELCMGIDIYIAGLLSPNDVTAPDINIASKLSGELAPIKAKLLEVVRGWAKDEYKIDTRLKDWVFKARYLQGGVPLAIIPLTAIDNIINQDDAEVRKISLEAYDTDPSVFDSRGYISTGILGPGINRGSKSNGRRSVLSTLRMESAGNTAADLSSAINIPSEQRDKILRDFERMKLEDGGSGKTVGINTMNALNNVSIHDNIEALKMPGLAIAAAKRSITRKHSPLYKMKMESDARVNASVENTKTISLEKGKLVYPNRQFALNEVVNVRPNDINDSVGQPIIQELPYGSCFPITPPGLPDQHIVYIIALDSTGSPLDMGEEATDMADPSDISIQSSSGVMGTQMLSQTADASIDGMTNIRHGSLNSASNRLFNSFLTADLKERLKTGLFTGVELDVKFTQAFLDQMWRRAMSGQQVQFLVIPSELMSYIAFDFDQQGMGLSKLTKHRGVAIVASTVQIANALSAINNSIQHKKATITFDDDEVDAFDTDEKLKQYIVRSQWANSLFTSSNTQDQLNHILNSGWHFSYENGNGAFPGTSFDVDYLTRESNQIDNEYLDSVNNRLIMLSGVSPEIVDMSQDVEFAQTYITGHMLRAQQATLEQQILCAGIDKLIKSFCLHSKPIIDELRNIINSAIAATENKITIGKKSVEELIEEFIDSIETSLPKPDATKLESQSKNLEAHEAYIDKVIEYYFDDPLFSSGELGEKLGEKLDLFKSVWKASYMRNILQSNNLVPKQFQALHGNVDDDDDFIDPFIESEQITENFSKLAIQHEEVISKLKRRNDTTVDRINDDLDNDSPDNSSDGDSSGDVSSSDDNSSETDDNADSEADDGDSLFGGDDDSNPIA